MSTLDNLTDEELEQAIALRKKRKADKKEKARQSYETNREDTVQKLMAVAKELNESLELFKDTSVKSLGAFYNQMKLYGEVKESNKGNFSIESEDGLQKILVSQQRTFGFDERVGIAHSKMSDFLRSFVKKRDQDVYELITALLETNATGDYDPRLIQKLYKMEDKFEDPRWVEAIAIFKESYTEKESKMYIKFYTREDSEQKDWSYVSLNFSSL